MATRMGYPYNIVRLLDTDIVDMPVWLGIHAGGAGGSDMTRHPEDGAEDSDN